MVNKKIKFFLLGLVGGITATFTGIRFWFVLLKKGIYTANEIAWTIIFMPWVMWFIFFCIMIWIHRSTKNE